MISRKNHRLLYIFLATIVLCLSISSNALAYSKTEMEQHTFTGTVPDGGLIVVWPVTFTITGEYSDYSNSRILDKIFISAYIVPLHSLGNGSINGTIDETIDYGSTTIRRLYSSFWKEATTITDSKTYTYFAKEGYPNKVFRSSAKEVGSYNFVCDGIVHNPLSYKITLDIGGPRSN